MKNSGDILERIVNAKRRRLEKTKARADIERLLEDAMASRAGKNPVFFDALSDSDGGKIIAEIKRASPSKGVISADIDIEKTARLYEHGGAAGVSVLTEEDYFLGGLGDLALVREAVSFPILRKDFIFDKFQVYESAAAGADAVLLIAGILDDEHLESLSKSARELNLDVLVEVHDECEMKRAIKIGANLIGVNNRNLRSFDVDLNVSVRLSKLAPPQAVLIAESGIRNRRDINHLAEFGFRGFLVGEVLMTSHDPLEKLRELAA